jgi:hypothetical protein
MATLQRYRRLTADRAVRPDFVLSLGQSPFSAVRRQG